VDGYILTLALVALAGLGIVAGLRVLQGAWRVVLIIAVIIIAVVVLIVLAC